MKRIAFVILWSLMFCTLWAQNVSDHFYAVILSGGRSRLMNHERYWNDCAFLYRTLRHDCHLPQQHIILLMSDGDDPAPDMLRSGAMGFASSPTDLDGDGLPDLHLAATRQNLMQTMTQLCNVLSTSDHLFIYVVDHADTNEMGEACLWLWNNEQLQPDELAAMLSPLQVSSTAIVLGHCHAGAFVPCLQGEGRIVVTACAADELSWACPDRPYDEFVYHWTCAIAQHDEEGNPVISDQNVDGYISMREAFDYACVHDRMPETPGITAQPQRLAERWSFSGLTDVIEKMTVSTALPTAYDLQGRRLHSHKQGLYIEGGQLKLKKR